MPPICWVGPAADAGLANQLLVTLETFNERTSKQSFVEDFTAAYL